MTDGVRRASIDEMRQRGAQLIAAHAAETGIDGDVQWRCVEALDRAGGLVLLVVEAGGELVGHCCASYGRELWSKRDSLTTLAVFVYREHSGRWGLPLLRAFVAEADRLGAVPRIQVLPGTQLQLLVETLEWRPCAVSYELPTP